MPSKELITWIKKKESEGHTPKRIEKYLIYKGYTPDQAAEAVMAATYQKPQFSQRRKSHSKLIVIILVSIAVIASGYIAYGFIFDKGEIVHVVSNTTQNLTDAENNTFGEINANIEVDFEAISDCGGMECFEENFANCAHSKLRATLAENIIYYYDIIGPNTEMCEVRSKFIANPNPLWIDEDMTCVYDNSLPFMTAIQDTSRCEGPLWDLMKGTTSS